MPYLLTTVATGAQAGEAGIGCTYISPQVLDASANPCSLMICGACAIGCTG